MSLVVVRLVLHNCWGGIVCPILYYLLSTLPTLIYMQKNIEFCTELNTFKKKIFKLLEIF